MAREKKAKKLLKVDERIKVPFSIKKKLLFVILPVVCVMMVLLSVLIIEKGEGVILDRSDELMKFESQEHAAQLQTTISEVLSEVKVLHQTIEIIANSGDEFIMTYLNYSMSVDERFPYGIYGGNKYGDYYDASWVPDDDYVCYERDWYIDGLNNSEMAFGEAYVDSQTGELCISASCKVANRDDDFVISADVFLNEIADKVAAYKTLDTGYCALLHYTGDFNEASVLAAPDSEILGKKVSELDASNVLTQCGDALNSSEGTVTTVKVGGEEYLVTVQPINDVTWYLLSIAPMEDKTGSVQSMTSFAVVVTIVALILVLGIVEIVINKVIAPIGKLTTNIDRMSKGDFSKFDEYKGRDEIALMSRELGDFAGTMRGMIEEIKNASTELAGQADTSASISGQLNTNASSQSTAMQELNDTVGALVASIAEVADAATELANSVNETGQKGASAADKMKNTVTNAASGKDGMARIQKAMNDIEKAMEILEDVVGKVGDSTSEITKFVEVIGSIASQTNLLALNASIEAARAGEAGKGFAVVAGEISHLADTSTEAVSEISSITDGINSLVVETVEQTKKSAAAIQESVGLVADVGSTFDSIYDNINEASDIVLDMVEEVKHVDSVATNVAAITEEQSASTQLILDTATELSDLATSVSNNSTTVAEEAESMSRTAETLSEQMNGFKVD